MLDSEADCVLFNLVGTTVMHPIEYARVLIQIGFEPLPPRESTSILGKRILKLPNVITYVKYIKQQDGYLGCFSGLKPRLCESLVYNIVSCNFTKYLTGKKAEEDEEDEEISVKEFLHNLKNAVIVKSVASIISHPMRVVSIRTMAQFVGKETKYNGIFASVREVYNTNGLKGFFYGLFPRLVGDILTMCITSSLTFVICKYFLKEKSTETYVSASMSLFATTFTYRFNVVSTCMAVSGSRLAAGCPPLMPYYYSTFDCWAHLNKNNQLDRGSSMLFRYYTGPVKMTQDGKLAPMLYPLNRKH